MSANKQSIFAYRLFTVQDLGFRDPERNLGRVIEEFLKIGAAVAARWVEMPYAVLILQMSPEDAASGAVYLYDRQRQTFYMICFDGDYDHLTRDDFDLMVAKYNLLARSEERRVGK